MRRLSSTVVVVAGERAGKVVSGLDGLHNVRAITCGERSPAEVADVVNRSVATYVVHDADPLGAVGDAWTGLFDGTVPVGGLEVAIEAALAALRSDRLVLLLLRGPGLRRHAGHPAALVAGRARGRRADARGARPGVRPGRHGGARQTRVGPLVAGGPRELAPGTAENHP